MQKNILEYLEHTLPRVPDKVAFADDTGALTFAQLSRCAKGVGSFLHAAGYGRQPVVVFMRKQPATVAAYLGCLYAGCYYVPLDPEMPRHRIDLILQALEPGAMICDESTLETGRELGWGKLYEYTAMAETPVDQPALDTIRRWQCDTDPVYIVFTSGSTGVPKGVMACHRNVIDYIDALSEVLGLGEDSVFANQAPLYMDACLKELIPTLKFGATTYLVPRQMFSFPLKLVEYLNEHKINTLCWVVSALTMVSSLRVFDKVVPEYVRTVAFAGEVFPTRQFNIWRETLPNAKFVNLYGPTEVTGVCCYYEVKTTLEPQEAMPVGQPFSNTGILLLKEDNTEAGPGESGEICVRGTCVTLGYYNDPERTALAYVTNPVNKVWPERIYRTGDLGYWNDQGQLMFMSRKDNQIKHMGHRIELGEIEAAVQLQENVNSACCLFDREKKKIILYYTGDITTGELAGWLKQKLPRYMVPHQLLPLDVMPLTPNGKIDRTTLKAKAGIQ